MEHIITIALFIMVILLTIIVYLQIEIINYNDDLEKRNNAVYNGKFTCKTTGQNTQGLPPPLPPTPPKTSNVYDKKFPSKNDNVNPAKSYLEEDADRRIKEFIKSQEEQAKEIEEFKKVYIENTKKWINDVPIVQSTHITYEEYVDALKDIANGPLGKKSYHIDENK